ncbi:MAG: CPBP family intramembrane metalloprotease, partial [Victivallaceae bacterium]|nr:CPBP family intramembrane metalloprotease [Victivallaceae bacterium]
MINKNETDPLSSLIRAMILLGIALLITMAISPLVFRAIRNLPALYESGFFNFLPEFMKPSISQFADYLAGQPFRRVFNRVILVSVVGVFAIGWRWIHIKLEIRSLFRPKRAISRWLTWFIIGSLCIAILVYAQEMAGMRYHRDKSLKLFAALLSAVTVGFLEETLFRGVLLQAFLKRVTVYKAIFITSAVFALVHLFSLDHFLKAIKTAAPDGSNLSDGFLLIATFFKPMIHPGLVLPGLIGLFLAGWLLAELTIRTKSLWAAIGMHSGWVFTIKVLGRIYKYPKTTEPSWFYGEKFAATGVLGWIVVGILILAVNGLVLYAIYRVFITIISLLTHKKAEALGRFLGKCGYIFSPRHRKIAFNNIREAFPEKSDNECKTIAKQSFETLGIVSMEFLVFEKMTKNFFDIVKPTGMEHIKEAQNKGKGIVFFTGHFGNWELLALGCALLKFPFTAVGRPLNNKWIYRHIKKVREKPGLRMLDKKGITRDVLKILQKNEMIGFVGDQYAGSGGLFVNFFGRTASTTPAMATFARKTGAALIPAFEHILPDGTHRPVIYPPIKIPQTDDLKKD